MTPVDPNAPDLTAVPPAPTGSSLPAGDRTQAPSTADAMAGSPSRRLPNLPAQTPAMPTQAPAPSNHVGWYTHVMNSLAGGGMRPVKDAQGNPVTDPKTGQVQMAQASKKTLGLSILAGAIAGMAGGFGPQKTGVSDEELQQFAQKTGTTQKMAQQGAQQEADAARARQYDVTDHNLKFHQMSLAMDKADRESQQDVVDNAYATMVNGMNNEYEKGNVVDKQGKAIDLWKAQNITGAEVQKLIADNTLHITKDMVVPVRSYRSPEGRW